MKSPARSFSLAARLRSILWAMLLLPIVAGVTFFLVHSVTTLETEAEAELKAALRLQQQFIESWVVERAGDIGTLAAARASSPCPLRACAACLRTFWRPPRPSTTSPAWTRQA